MYMYTLNMSELSTSGWSANVHEVYKKAKRCRSS